MKVKKSLFSRDRKKLLKKALNFLFKVDNTYAGVIVHTGNTLKLYFNDVLFLETAHFYEVLDVVTIIAQGRIKNRRRYKN